MPTIKSLHYKRGSFKGKVTVIESTISSEQQLAHEDLQVLDQQLEEAIKGFNDVQMEIYMLPDLNDSQAAEEEIEENSFTDRTMKIRFQIKKFMRELPKAPVPVPKESSNELKEFLEQQVELNKTLVDSIKNNATPDSSVKLPQLSIPKFTGKYSEWASFKDLYTCSIDSNKSLTSAQKLQYLKGYLGGEAEALIRHLAVTGDNYTHAWKLIQDRYEKKQSIVSEHIQSFLDQPSVSGERSAMGVRKLYNVSQETIQALDALQCNQRDIWLIHILTNKLDKESKMLWARESCSSEMATWEQFMQFLENRSDSLELVYGKGDESQQSKKIKDDKSSKPGQKFNNQKSAFNATEGQNCVLCSQGNHKVFQCLTFINASPKQKLDMLLKHRFCVNCLKRSHTVDSCSSTLCRRCQQRHNTLLHDAFAAPGATGITSENATQPASSSGATGASGGIKAQPREGSNATAGNSTSAVAQFTASSSFVGHPMSISQQALLPTVSLHVIDQEGRRHKCRALLDSCSQPNFVCRRLVEKCKLTTYNKSNQTILGIGGQATPITKAVRITIESTDHQFVTNAEFSIMDSITDNQPAMNIIMPWTIPSDIHLADPHFATPGKIDMLLGVNVFCQVIRGNTITGSPTLFETAFGYVVAGNCPMNGANNDVTCLCFSSSSNDDDKLHAQVEKFWDIERVKYTKPLLSKEELACEHHFQHHVTRDATGRYVVQLPTRDKVNQLGDSHDVAMRRFFCIERRLQRDPAIREKYISFMEEYERLGHMRPLPPTYKSDRPAVYLPHHPVVKTSSTSTPVRVVFDASAKTSTGISLNNVLMVGPKLQDDIFNILIRFRQHNIVIKGDIAKMFRQIKVADEDQTMQRILWRRSPQEPIQTYLLSTITYGTGSASFLSVRCIQQLAEDEGTSLPLAKDATLSDFYVDDFLSGQATVESAQELRRQMSNLMEKGGFHLTKWRSNNPEALEGLPKEDIESSTCDDLGSDDTTKALGIRWSPSQDCFMFIHNTNPNECFTKRSILSEISRIYDPLGFLAPVVITAKIIMQSSWKTNTDWDDIIKPDHEIFAPWSQFKQHIAEVEHIRIPRQMTSHQNPKEYHLLVFGDASEKAYAACIYMMTFQDDSDISCRFLDAKTRVAPLKPLSIARLELLAAELVAELYISIKDTLTVSISSVRAFSDNTTVLHWLAKEPNTWKQFVANRVAKIQELLPTEHWSYIPSKMNPADLATRGLTPGELRDNQLWWHGPDISAIDDSVPEDTDMIEESVNLERRKTCGVSTAKDSFNFWDIIYNYSSHEKLIRHLAILRRYAAYLRAKFLKADVNSSPISATELRETNLIVVSAVQKKTFPEEFKAMNLGKSLPSTSRILDLNPFLDENNVIRVGGRIQNSNLPITRKHQMLLPDKNHFTELIAKRTHIETLHGGPQMVFNTMRQQYWTLRGIDVAKAAFRMCIKCFRCKPKPAHQIMGNLPKSRVQVSRPFQKVGIDFCGPFQVKFPVRSNITMKVYVAIFICFVTKAIHLEIVTQLSSDAFIAALRRFIARRGKPSDIFCDNATNFVGAAGQIDEMQQLLAKKEVQFMINKFSADRNITFHFIPPRSPHFGGLWENAVKLFKLHFYRVVGNTRLTLEALHTVIAEIEMILNSRPLTPASQNPLDFEVLTPGHFLIGEPLNALPAPDVSDVPSNRLTPWRLNDQMVQHFWNRWTHELLLGMQKRPKWQLEQRDIQPDDLVVVIEDNLPPLSWLLGRVIDTQPGADGRTRVVTVRTQNGVFKRNITRIAPLPLAIPSIEGTLKVPLQPREHVPENSAN